MDDEITHDSPVNRGIMHHINNVPREEIVYRPLTRERFNQVIESVYNENSSPIRDEEEDNNTITFPSYTGRNMMGIDPITTNDNSPIIHYSYNNDGIIINESRTSTNTGRNSFFPSNPVGLDIIKVSSEGFEICGTKVDSAKDFQEAIENNIDKIIKALQDKNSENDNFYEITAGNDVAKLNIDYMGNFKFNGESVEMASAAKLLIMVLLKIR